MEKRITNLTKIVDALPPNERKLFQRIFDVEETLGRIILPKTMYGWVKERFGDTKVVEEQKIVKVTNLVTMESSLFNELRSLRPIQVEKKSSIKILAKEEGCIFCNPTKNTPTDVFGRVRGRHCITASNLTKYEGLHGVVIFKKHNPLELSFEEISDCIDVSFRWFKKANKVDKKAVYPFFMWNCLWRSGASIVHGHVQVALSRKPYSKVEHLRKVSENYQKKFGSDYFEDLFKVHSFLGLGFLDGKTKIMAYLTPVKEKEVLLTSPRMDMELKKSIYKVFLCYRKLGVESFNLCVLMPPLKVKDDWKNFPVVVRILDRGKLFDRTSDIGAMELYGSSVISSDPFRLVEAIRKIKDFS
ncbi:hypothetical protein DRO26_04775 [Candidatus Bathyarchaeota archaeon]|mgnify:CR=1 FL=1|nr:MAG: hypothetical protein DRO26_04775 [Candidatus Bathyarchaeota archaeon]